MFELHTAKQLSQVALYFLFFFFFSTSVVLLFLSTFHSSAYSTSYRFFHFAFLARCYLEEAMLLTSAGSDTIEPVSQAASAARFFFFAMIIVVLVVLTSNYN